MLARTVVPALTLIGCAVWPPDSLPAKSYYVGQSHPRASDENAGTETLPWKTKIWNNIVISKARSIAACENKRHELTAALPYGPAQE